MLIGAKQPSRMPSQRSFCVPPKTNGNHWNDDLASKGSSPFLQPPDTTFVATTPSSPTGTRQSGIDLRPSKGSPAPVVVTGQPRTGGSLGPTHLSYGSGSRYLPPRLVSASIGRISPRKIMMARCSALIVGLEWWPNKYDLSLSLIQKDAAITVKRVVDKVYVTVLQATDEEITDARKIGIELILPKLKPGLSSNEPTTDWLVMHEAYFPDLKNCQDIGLIISHAHVNRTLHFARDIHQIFPTAKLVTLVHHIPEETFADSQKPDESVKKENEILEYAGYSDLILSVGPKVFGHFNSKFKRLQNKGVHFCYLPSADDMFLQADISEPDLDTEMEILSVNLPSTRKTFNDYNIVARAMGKVANHYEYDDSKPTWKICGISNADAPSCKTHLNSKASSPHLNINICSKKCIDDIYEDLKQCCLYLHGNKKDPFGILALSSIAAGVPTLIDSESGVAMFLQRSLSDQSDRVIVNVGPSENEANMSETWARKIYQALRQYHKSFSSIQQLRNALLQSVKEGVIAESHTEIINWYHSISQRKYGSQSPSRSDTSSVFSSSPNRPSGSEENQQHTQPSSKSNRDEARLRSTIEIVGELSRSDSLRRLRLFISEMTEMSVDNPETSAVDLNSPSVEQTPFNCFCWGSECPVTMVTDVGKLRIPTGALTSTPSTEVELAWPLGTEPVQSTETSSVPTLPEWLVQSQGLLPSLTSISQGVQLSHGEEMAWKAWMRNLASNVNSLLQSQGTTQEGPGGLRGRKSVGARAEILPVPPPPRLGSGVSHSPSDLSFRGSVGEQLTSVGKGACTSFIEGGPLPETDCLMRPLPYSQQPPQAWADQASFPVSYQAAQIVPTCDCRGGLQCWYPCTGWYAISYGVQLPLPQQDGASALSLSSPLCRDSHRIPNQPEPS
uniref:Uncharacterized protein LOC100368975 n=1 Tax=Saccoglossus kowalevskii TaxID=10224 RepID=A0ABM0GKF4_SACKO|nr:PREDICTED: uncharacterized protein LOC100368975 [Saccoglossus kowalevskii]